MPIRGVDLQRFARGRSAITLVDQVLVSGSNFLTGIILVRGLGLVAFGQFTVAYVILLLANSIQLSFIASPMITLGSLCSTEEERHVFVRGVYGVQLLFCAIATIGTVVATVIYSYFDKTVVPSNFLLPFTAAVALFLMQDWLRRYYFTIGKAPASLWNDAINYVVQVILPLRSLGDAPPFTIGAAFWAIAITSGMAFVSRCSARWPSQ